MQPKDLRQFEEKMQWKVPEDFRAYVLEKYALDETTTAQERFDDLVSEMNRYQSGELSLHGKTVKECLLEEQVQRLRKRLQGYNRRLADAKELLEKYCYRTNVPKAKEESDEEK